MGNEGIVVHEWELHLEGEESREEGKIMHRVWTMVGLTCK